MRHHENRSRRIRRGQRAAGGAGRLRHGGEGIRRPARGVGPFAEGNHGIFTHPVLTKIGEKYGKSAAQVALRWNVQRGVVIIPKSVHKDRMEQNIDIWDFQLNEEDMKAIEKLDMGKSEIVDHFNPEFVKMIHSVKVHD